jgi:hypothetical protein
MQKILYSYDPALLTSAREIEAVITNSVNHLEEIEMNLKNYIDLSNTILRYEPFKKK